MTTDALVNELTDLIAAHSAIGDEQHAARFASIHKMGGWVLANAATLSRLTRELAEAREERDSAQQSSENWMRECLEARAERDKARAELAAIPEDPDERAEYYMHRLIEAVSQTDDKWLSEVTDEGWNVNVSNPEVYDVDHEPERPDDENDKPRALKTEA